MKKYNIGHFIICFILASAITAFADITLKVYAKPETREFPEGYEIISTPSETASLIKTMASGSATIAGYADVNGKRYFVSNWSYERYKTGQSYNWIRPKEAANQESLKIVVQEVREEQASDSKVHESNYQGSTFRFTLPSKWEDITPDQRKGHAKYYPGEVNPVVFFSRPDGEDSRVNSITLQVVPAEESPKVLTIEALEQKHMRYILASEGLGAQFTRAKVKMLGKSAHGVMTKYRRAGIGDGSGKTVIAGDLVIHLCIIMLEPLDGKYYLLEYIANEKNPLLGKTIQEVADRVGSK